MLLFFLLLDIFLYWGFVKFFMAVLIAGRLCLGRGHCGAQVLQGLLRPGLHPAQDGSGGRTRLLYRGHGELGPAHVQGDGPAVPPLGLHPVTEAVRGHTRVPRGGAPVVRQPRLHRLVGPAVAEGMLSLSDRY